MTLNQSALLELTEVLRSADGGEMMRLMLAKMLQALVDAEATAHIGAAAHERNQARITQRNGTREKVVSTTSGDLTVKIAKTRTGSFFPSLLAPRRRIDVALHAVVMEAYVHGVSTRKVDDLVAALGVDTGISKSEVSRICAGLDAEVDDWAGRPLGHIAFPYVFVDATYSQGEDQRAGGVPGHRDRHRRVGGWAPGGPRQRGRGFGDTGVLGGVPARSARARPGWGAAGDL
jgi:putative transposase